MSTRGPLRRARAAGILGAVLLMTLGAVSLSSPASSAPASPAQDVSALATTFADEFNGAAGAAVDGSKWQLETGDNVNNHERQMYTNRTSNASTDGAGNLVITARRENPNNYNCWYGRCEYTSARLNTAGKFTQTYGHYETRMKLPRGQGMWPAFWMLGADINSGNPWPGSGEIDIMENVGFEPNTVHGTLHGPGYSGSGGIGAGYNGPNFSDAFHTYAIDWAPNQIRWSVDGNVYQTRTPADLNGNQWVFNKPFFIIMNLAVGGYWPGDPNSATQFPQQLLVDYVRVTTSDSNPPPTGGGRIVGLAGKCLDVAGANSANGTPIQIVGCNNNAAQNWSRPGDGTIRALGKCLDAAAAGTANGTLVQLWDCNGTGAQQWAVSGARDIVNIPANKCLDVIGNNSADGARTNLWECTGGANQKWTV
jgi:beta-glucanase (GH16 family)